MTGVYLQDVRKRYGSLDVLHGVSASIEAGEFAVLVGPSGCGKSTLLRMIAGLEEISAGTIRIGDKVVNAIPPKDRDIAMVFQNYALYPHMTVAENMGFSLMLRRDSNAKIAARVKLAADSLGLSGHLGRYPRELSGGQRQRVAMGRAIVRDPQVYLFDEPLSNLDAKLRVAMRAELRELQQKLKTTTIYVTHDQIEAMTMADKIIVMNGGRIEQIGKPLAVYDRPANTFVATFIGSPAMNLLPGRVEDRAGKRWFVSATGHDFALPDSTPHVAAATAVTFGIRPEDIHLGDAGIPASVVLVEPTGAETLVCANLAGQTLSVMTRERVEAAPGTEVRLILDANKAHLFDTATGVRLERG